MATDQAHIVSQIYDAAIEPTLWPVALDSIAMALGAVGAGYFIFDKRTGSPRAVEIVGPAAEVRDDYVAHYAPIDSFRKKLDTAPLDRWEWLTDCLPPERLRQDEWYNDFVVRCGVGDALGARVFDDGHNVVMVGIHRGLKQRPSDVEPAPHLRPLFEAIGKAGRLQCGLAQVGWKSAVALQALDRVATAVIIADETGRVVECNAAAERILRIDDGLGVRGGQLSPRRAFEALKLARMIATAAATSNQATGHMLIGRVNGHASYVVTVAPLGPELALGGRPLAMVLVADPDEHAPSRKDLTEFFGFSPAESRLAAALMEGRKLDQIADELGVRITTLRTQVSSVLKKAGVERQADLIRVLSAVRLIETNPNRRRS